VINGTDPLRSVEEEKASKELSLLENTVTLMNTTEVNITQKDKNAFSVRNSTGQDAEWQEAHSFSRDTQ
jgi:hypothetical protein